MKLPVSLFTPAEISVLDMITAKSIFVLLFLNLNQYSIPFVAMADATELHNEIMNYFCDL